ncbi:hypothetical protein ACT3SZ_13405 [Corynebacterium sp. AOP40-9SA-29]|uniref:hypothetical protein n=1 Tax=Corynebacterium sp. AOP40-9SA-29 TaxID=3457677 RepID=UPI0040341B6F
MLWSTGMLLLGAGLLRLVRGGRARWPRLGACAGMHFGARLGVWLMLWRGTCASKCAHVLGVRLLF